jgi:hypothetical protein
MMKIKAYVAWMGKLRTALIAAASAAVLTACASSGQYFLDKDVAALQPGHTTVADAAVALGFWPQQVYPQSDGSELAVWSFKFSLVTDAVYHRKDVMLQFGPDGRLMRLADSTNVMLSSESRRKLVGAYTPADNAGPPGSAWEPASPQ